MPGGKSPAREREERFNIETKSRSSHVMPGKSQKQLGLNSVQGRSQVEKKELERECLMREMKVD